MKKKEIVDRVLELVSDKSGEMRSLVNGWVDIVLDDVASRGLLNSLKREERTNLIKGQRHYDLKEDTDIVYKVFVPAWGEPEARLTKKTDEEFLQLMLEDGWTKEGRPHSYNIFGARTLRVHPIPDTDNAPASPTDLQKIYVWKYKDIEHLDEENEISEVKIKHIPTIIHGAYAMGAKFDSIVDAAGAQAAYERGCNRIVGDQSLDLERAKQVQYRDLG